MQSTFKKSVALGQIMTLKFAQYCSRGESQPETNKHCHHMVALFHYLESFIGNSAYQQFNPSRAEKQVDRQAGFEFL